MLLSLCVLSKTKGVTLLFIVPPSRLTLLQGHSDWELVLRCLMCITLLTVCDRIWLLAVLGQHPQEKMQETQDMLFDWARLSLEQASNERGEIRTSILFFLFKSGFDMSLLGMCVLAVHVYERFTTASFTIARLHCSI